VIRERQRRVLVADDDPLVRNGLAAVLESEGYEAIGAEDGRSTVVRVMESPPDLILLDLNMPNGDGWGAFVELDQLRPLIPVIVITARPNQYNEAVRLGVDAFMEKPLDFPVLLDAVRRYITEPAEEHVRRVSHRSFVTELLTSGVNGTE
jgi:CheY-like chemotaxis protein